MICPVCKGKADVVPLETDHEMLCAIKYFEDVDSFEDGVCEQIDEYHCKNGHKFWTEHPVVTIQLRRASDIFRE